MVHHAVPARVQGHAEGHRVADLHAIGQRPRPGVRRPCGRPLERRGLRGGHEVDDPVAGEVHLGIGERHRLVDVPPTGRALQGPGRRERVRGERFGHAEPAEDRRHVERDLVVRAQPHPVGGHRHERRPRVLGRLRRRRIGEVHEQHDAADGARRPDVGVEVDRALEAAVGQDAVSRRVCAPASDARAAGVGQAVAATMMSATDHAPRATQPVASDASAVPGHRRTSPGRDRRTAREPAHRAG